MKTLPQETKLSSNYTQLIINAFSLDASNKELNAYLVKNDQLPDIVTGLKKKDIEKITLTIPYEFRELFKDIEGLEKTIINEYDFFKIYSSSQEETTFVNISKTYNNLGTEIVVSIKGPLNKPGIYTIAPNTPLKEIVYAQADGLKSKFRKLKGLLLGGSFGTVIDEKALSSNLTSLTNSFKAYPLDNNLIVIDDTSCMVNLVKILTLYNYQKLSLCSKCNFCQQQLAQACDLLEKITNGQGTKIVLEELATIIEEKLKKARCLLGKQALLPLETALETFEKEFTEHITHKYCRASVCENLFLSPCTNACPANVDLPGTIGLMQNNLFIEALALGRETNPFFLSCGRICEEPLCQKYCQRQTIDSPINSRALHRYTGEIAAEKAQGLNKALNHPSLQPVSLTNKKIAIVGAGPSGLSAAYFLARLGHKVTIFEKLTVPGGMMYIGIPDYRLPPEILSAEINHILSLGVEIKYNTKLGKDITLTELKEKYDALYLAIGAHSSNTMGIPGENLPHVYSGIEFLRKVNLKEEIIVGPKVLVVGGGNVAIDAARCALRLGSKEVKIAYRRDLSDMPAAEEEILQAQIEGIEILPLLNPVEIIKNDRMIVKLEKMNPGKFDISGRKKPEKTNDFLNLEFDTIIVAIGQSPEIECLDGTGILTKWKQVQIDLHGFNTNLKGIFAGGDCVLGPATAVEAIGHGRKAALAIHNYLMPDIPTNFTGLRSLLKKFIGPSSCEPFPQQNPQNLEVPERIKGFEEVEKSLTEAQAQEEMLRCICSAKTGL